MALTLSHRDFVRHQIYQRPHPMPLSNSQLKENKRKETCAELVEREESDTGLDRHRRKDWETRECFSFLLQSFKLKKGKSTHAEGELLSSREALLGVDDSTVRMDPEAAFSVGRLHQTVNDAAIIARVAVESFHL